MSVKLRVFIPRVFPIPINRIVFTFSIKWSYSLTPAALSLPQIDWPGEVHQSNILSELSFSFDDCTAEASVHITHPAGRIFDGDELTHDKPPRVGR